jgi:hypothetical protein
MAEEDLPGVKESMMGRMVAFCGIVCSECPALEATQEDDGEDLKRVAAEWSEMFGQDLTAEDCICDGCLATDGRRSSYCKTCQIRACGVERRVQNCAHCEEYACDKLTRFLKEVPGARAVLEEIRAGL